jgi:hypothetical protein
LAAGAVGAHGDEDDGRDELDLPKMIAAMMGSPDAPMLGG